MVYENKIKRKKNGLTFPMLHVNGELFAETAIIKIPKSQRVDNRVDPTN